MTLLRELFPSAYYAIPTVLSPNHVRNVGVICHQSEPEGRKKGKNSSRNSSEGTGSNSQIITANIHGKPSLCAMHDFPWFPCVHALSFTTAPCTQHYCAVYTTLLQPSMLPGVSQWVSGCVGYSRPKKQTVGAWLQGPYQDCGGWGEISE